MVHWDYYGSCAVPLSPDMVLKALFQHRAFGVHTTIARYECGTHVKKLRNIQNKSHVVQQTNA